MRRAGVLGALVALLLVGAGAIFVQRRSAGPALHAWSPEEERTLRSLSLAVLGPPPPDPSNRVADDPAAVTLGHRLFFDSGLSASGELSCASCHRPDHYFADDRPLSVGLGTTRRHAPSLVGSAYSPWLYWDGRKDSLWAQALAPLEHPDEQGITRVALARHVADRYRADYEALFGPLPDLSDESRFPIPAGPEASEGAARRAWTGMRAEDREQVNQILVNVGKAIAAYERRLNPGASRFDRYVNALVAGDVETMAGTLSADEVAGLRLFIGEANCTQCHNGPMLTHNEFQNIGLPWLDEGAPDEGRAAVIDTVDRDPFNCLGAYSDAGPDDCAELRFMRRSDPELLGSFRTPSLRNVAETAPYMHDGRFANLAAVLVHYNVAPTTIIGHSHLVPLGLDSEELRQLEAFLRTLTGPIAAPPELLAPPVEN